jgi:Mce-associated membrane protein
MIDTDTRAASLNDDAKRAASQPASGPDTEDSVPSSTDDDGHDDRVDASDAASGEADSLGDHAEPKGHADQADGATRQSLRRRLRTVKWTQLLVFGVLPLLVLALAVAAGWLKYRVSLAHDSDLAGSESVHAAADAATKMLSYRPDTVEHDLHSARDLLGGPLKDSYTSLIHDVVIPGAQQKHISAVASVPATASVSATPTHAVVLVFVNQTIIVGNDAPSETASSVRVSMDKVGNRWLVTEFTPV